MFNEFAELCYEVRKELINDIEAKYSDPGERMIAIWLAKGLVVTSVVGWFFLAHKGVGFIKKQLKKS